MALEREFERLRDRKQRFAELRSRAEREALSRPSLFGLAKCLRVIEDSYATQLEPALSSISAVKATFLQEAASQTHNLEMAVELLQVTLGSCLQRLDEIPDELVLLVKWYFQRVGIEAPAFAIAVDEKVAMLTVSQLTRQSGLSTVFAPLADLIEQDPAVGSFVIFMVPEPLLRRSNSLNWSVLAHEVGHAYLERHPVLAEHYKGVPRDWRSMKTLAAKGRPDALKFFQLQEYACDEIAVRLTGCAFAWRLLTDFFSLENLSTPTHHPQTDKRVRRAVALAKGLGFEQESRAIIEQLEGEVDQVNFGVIQEDVDAEVLASVSKVLAETIEAVGFDALRAICSSQRPPLTVDEAKKRIRGGVPLAIDAWAVLCLATPDREIHTRQHLQIAVADSIRLGQVKSTFAKLDG